MALRDRVLAGDGGQATLDPDGVLKFAGLFSYSPSFSCFDVAAVCS